MGIKYKRYSDSPRFLACLRVRYCVDQLATRTSTTRSMPMYNSKSSTIDGYVDISGESSCFGHAAGAMHTAPRLDPQEYFSVVSLHGSKFCILLTIL